MLHAPIINHCCVRCQISPLLVGLALSEGCGQVSKLRARDSLARARESESVREMKKRERKSLFLFIIHDLLIPPRSAHSTRPRLAREVAQNSAPRSIAPGQHLLQTGHGSLSSRVTKSRQSVSQRISLARARDSLARESESVREMKKRESEKENLYFYLLFMIC